MFKLITMIVFCAVSAGAAVTNWPSGYQFLMVDQHGTVKPEGYATGLSEIARLEAEAASVRQAADLVIEVKDEASAIVDDVVDALTGTFGTAYVTGHTISFAGAVEVSTNVSAQIVFMELGAGGSMTTNAINYTGHYVWHVYSEAMNSTPAIKYKRNLDGTNAWSFAEYQSTAEFASETVNDVTYDVVYRSTVWLPSIYDGAFFMTFCEIVGGGQAGAVLDVYEGISIGGKVGFTGTIVRDGYSEEYDGGFLMSVTPVEVE